MQPEALLKVSESLVQKIRADRYEGLEECIDECRRLLIGYLQASYISDSDGVLQFILQQVLANHHAAIELIERRKQSLAGQIWTLQKGRKLKQMYDNTHLD